MGKRALGRRLIAYHEAGHAVVARKLGVEVAYIDMIAAVTPTNSAEWAAVQAGNDRGALTRGIHTDLMVILAGMAAQKIAGYPINGNEFIGNDTAEDGDNALRRACQIARIEAGLPPYPSQDEPQELKPGDPLYTAGYTIYERAWAETVTVLQDNWRAVVRVADVLAKQDRLSQAELDHVIAHGQR